MTPSRAAAHARTSESSTERGDECSRLYLPDHNRSVGGRGDGPLAVGRHRHGVDGPRMAFEGAQLCPLARSQTFSVSSPEPETARVPSGVTATALTEPAWPSRVRSSARSPGPRPSASRHCEAETARLPSGVTATALTQPAWPSRVRSRARSSRSQTFSVLSPDAETARCAVGRHRHGPDPVGMALEGAQLAPAVEVPDLQRPVIRGRDGALCRRASPPRR